MFSTVTLGDGRSLEYVDLGDPAGVPLLLCHGTPGTSGSAQIFAGPASDQGVRLIAPSRPGYGASTSTAPGLASVAADMLELADRLGVSRFATVGVSGGGPFALAGAVIAPDRVTQVALLAGTAAYFDVMPACDEDAAEREAMATYTAGDVDGAVAQMTRSGDADFGGLRGLSDDDFAAAMASQAPPGESWLDRHPAELAIFLADFRRAIDTPAGYVRDNLSWGSGWDVDLAAISSPVRMVYGDADTMVPMAHAEWLRDRLPTAELHVVPGGHGDASFGAAEATFAAIRAAS